MKKIIMIISILLLTPISSYAVPGFARQTGETCNDCHTFPPKLNMDGMLFKLGGYASGKKMLSQDIGEGKTLLQFNPISLRLLSSYSDEKGNDAEVIFPETLTIFFAGWVVENVGAFISPEFEDGEGWGVESAKVSIVKDFGDLIVGVTGGKTAPTNTDPFNSIDMMRLITRQVSTPMSAVMGTGLLDMFDNDNRGASLYAFIGNIFYVNAGAYTGVSKDMEEEAINKEASDPLDFFGRVAILTEGAPQGKITAVDHLNVGLFTYIGKEEYPDPFTNRIAPADDLIENKPVRYGIDFGVQKPFGDFTAGLTGLYMINQDEPEGQTGETYDIDHRGFQVWGELFYKSKIALLLGYGEYKFDDPNPFVDLIPSNPDKREDSTAHISYRFRPNVRFGAEYTYTNWQEEENSYLTSLILDLSF